MKLRSLGGLLLLAWAVTSCDGEPSAPEPPPALNAMRTARQEVRSTNKVLILGSSVAGGLGSREAQAVRAHDPSTKIDVVTSAQWSALTANEFMAYRALIIGDAECQSGTSVFQAAIDNRATWGAVVDGDVFIIATNPVSNNTSQVVESGVNYVLGSEQALTGMYISLGCAYQSAQAEVAVTLLEPFGPFKVQGLKTCADSAHIFQMSPGRISGNIGDDMLVGAGCAARSVFTSYPDHTFSFVALGMNSSDSQIPGEKVYIDFTTNPGHQTPFLGTPYILLRGASPYGAGCGVTEQIPQGGEECDLGEGFNGVPADRAKPDEQTCSWSCHNNWCGDGKVDVQFGEECDNGINNGRDPSGTLGACSSFCKFTHIQSQGRPPIAVCQNATVSATNQCGMTADIDGGSSDPDGDLLGCTQSPAGPYNIGDTAVTLTCTDRAGNSATCSATVTVLDKVAPVVTLSGPVNQSAECTKNSSYTDPGFSANDMCSGSLPQSSVTKTGTVNLGAPSTYTLSYFATDPAGNKSATVTRTVNVADTLAPVITAPAVGTVECAVQGYNDTGVAANDQCEGDVTSRITKTGTVNTAAVGDYKLTYTVSDTAGHTAQANRTVPVRDTLKPTVTLNPPVSQTVECGGTYTDPSATASDACAGSLAPLVNNNSINMAVPGSYAINYKATDPSGNTGVSSDRVVTVQDTLAPGLLLNGSANLSLECAAAFTDPGATAIDQCYGNITSSVVITGAVNSRLLNTPQTLTYNVKDPKNNAASSVTRTVTVRDTQAPVITINGALSQAVECGAGYTDPGATAGDACAGVVAAVATPPANSNVPGNYTVKYTATDPSGNTATSSGSRSVTVQDTLPPTLTLLGQTNPTLECGSSYADPGATASDQCAGNLTTSITKTGTIDNKTPATYPLHYTVSDGNGHSVSMDRSVAVKDTLAPTVTITGQTAVTVECGSSYTDPGATASDACVGTLPAVATSTPNLRVPGNYSVAYKATDPSGNVGTSSGSRTVTVRDTLPPTITLNGQATMPLECGSPFSDPGATANDQCVGNLSVTVAGGVNNKAPASYTLTYSANDGSGHSASTSRTVTVQDTQPPTITVLGALDQTYECGSTYADPGATADDVCAGDLTASIEASRSGNTNSPGSFTITYSVTDPSGHSTTSPTVRTVHVNDNTPPTLSLTGPAVQNIECADLYADPGATANDACFGNVSSRITETGSVNNMAPGSYHLTYNVSDPAGQAAPAVSRTVNVADTKKPVVTITGPLNVPVECGDPAYTDQGATANDACAGVLPAVATSTANPNAPGNYVIGYKATDPSGNVGTSSGSRTVTVSDTKPPVLALNGQPTSTLECGTPYTDPGATASDQCAGNLTAQVSRNGTVNEKVPATYPLHYTVSDGSGHTASADRTVTVHDTVAPVITVKGPLNDTFACGSTYTDPGATATDACAGSVPVTSTQTGDPTKPGQIIYTYSAIDPSGNSVTSPVHRTVTVDDHTPPTLALLGSSTQSLECGSLYNDPGATANDACFGDLSSSIVRTGSVNNMAPASYQLTYNVTDPAGNSPAAVHRTVSVSDTQAPTITVLGSLSQSVQCGSGPYADPSATANDACAGDLTSTIVKTGSVNSSAAGSYTIKYSVTDPSGNSVTSSDVRSVTVVDDLPPTIKLNGQTNMNQECGTPYVEPGATAADACAGDLTGQVAETGQVEWRSPGNYVVYYSVSDPSNNAAETVARFVTVRDTLPPVLTLNGLALQNLECGTPYTELGATAKDVCTGDLTGNVFHDGFVNPHVPDDYTIHYFVNDFAGNDATSVSRTVRVQDTQKPTLTVLGSTSATYECGTIFMDPGATATDSCAGELTSAIVPTRTPNPDQPGNFTVTYSVTDPSGNTTISPVTRTVTRNDSQPPTLSLNGPASQVLECSRTPYNDLGAMANDVCEGSVPVQVTGSVNTQVAGNYVLGYTAQDTVGNTSPSVTRNVQITDTVGPAITLNGDNAVTVECKGTYTDLGATAEDLCSGLADVTTDNLVNTDATGVYVVRYHAMDASGNSNEVVRNVSVTDTQAPTLSLNQPELVQLECGTPYVEPGATAADACAGDLSAAIVMTGTVDPHAPGQYTVVYNVADPSGNSASAASRTVTVVDDQPPEIICPGPRVVETLDGEEADTGSLEAAQAKDACDPEVRISNPTQTRFPVGTTTVTYTATDAAGNTASCSSTITVLNSAPPSTGDIDRDFLGGGRGCSSTESGPSSLAMLGLGLFVALRARKRTGARVLVLAASLLGARAFAQAQPVPSFELELLKLNPSGTGSLVLGTGELLPAGDYRFSLTTHYEKDPLVLFQDGTRVGVVIRHRATAQLAAAYGLWGRVELGAQVPVLLLQRGDDLTDRGVTPPEGGPALGTPLLTLRAKLLAEREQDPMDLSLGVQAGPALGQGAALARELRATPNLMVGRRFGPLHASIDAGILLRSRTILSPDANIHDEIGSSLRLGAAISSLGEDLRGELAVIASVPFTREGFSVETLAGARRSVGDSVEVYGLAGLGYGNAPGTPDVRALLGVAYGRTRPACVTGGKHEPQSCPDLDDDGDGVKNRDDRCPRELGAMDNQGCPLKDTDSDGIADGVDRCPTVPGPPALQGCPDQDGDGIEDAADMCPAEPGTAALQGCPVKDADGDGVLDTEDACPSEAGSPEMQGCPVKDTDSDSVPDHLDNCPEVAGPAENQGCPSNEKQLVAIQKDRIQIQDTIYFDFDRATIQSRSFPLLDQVAQVLVEHPEIQSVTIEGHTDDRGAAEYNRDLSQRRAESVRDYLAQKGVARERMEPKGFGEDRPIQPNTTEEGRTANRRVEFITHSIQAAP